MQQKIRHLVQAGLKKRNLLIMPLVVTPLLTFLLWSLDLVGETQINKQGKDKSGINMNLPSPIPAGDSTWNKLRYYEQADKDSVKLRSLMKNDPLFQSSRSLNLELANKDNALLLSDSSIYGYNFSYNPYPKVNGIDNSEERVVQKLNLLKTELSKSRPRPHFQKLDQNIEDEEPSLINDKLDKLENVMKDAQGSNSSDPEMQQINGMLEKILDIQHPDRIKDKLKQYSQENKQKAYPVIVKNHPVQVSLLQSKSGTPIGVAKDTILSNLQIHSHNYFYSFNEVQTSPIEQNNSIKANIDQTQTLTSGGKIKLRLGSEVFINGLLIPKGHIVIGAGMLNGDRLSVRISSIRYKDNILPVDISAYDMDGMEGIYIPDAISRDVSKEATDQAIQSIGLASLDPSLGAQAASAGLQAAKSLIGKKMKLIKVTVKAGYQVLLADNNQRN